MFTVSNVCLSLYLTQNTVRLDYKNSSFDLSSLFIQNMVCLNYENQKRTDKMYAGLHVTCLLLLTKFNQNQNMSLNF